MKCHSPGFLEGGRICFRDGDKEVLYVPENGRYVLYEPGQDGTFITSGSAQYTIEHIDSSTVAI